MQLAAGEPPEAVLPAIARRLVEACPGSGCILLVDRAEGAEPLVHTAGVDEESATALAAQFAGGHTPAGALVVDLQAGDRSYGRIALLTAAGRDPAVQDLLAAYAGHAAAALSGYEAREQERLSRGRAGALAGLSRSLIGTEDPLEVCRLVAGALPETLGCDSGAVWLWDPTSGIIQAVATAGLPPELDDLLLQWPVRPAETPELAELLAQREPLVLQAGRVTPVLEELLRSLDLSTALGVPLVGGTRLLGAATASWTEGPLDILELTEAVTRLQGVADRASTALQNARLVEQIRHQSMHDPLTGLPNRVLFHDHLDKALQAAGRTGGAAVLFCDLDRFKSINDAHGHGAGDEVLRQVAARLGDAVRPGDSVGRLSGDEFAAVLTGVQDVATAWEVAQRLLECFDQPVRVEGHQLVVTASIGVAFHAGSGGTGEAVLRAADAAMYTAKRQGRSRIVLADSVFPTSGAPSASTSSQLRRAIAAGELRLVYQPVMAFRPGDRDGDRAGRLAGAEALVRWDHPRRGLLSPAAFVPQAERDGSVVDLDRWVLHEACREAAGWARASPTGRHHVAVNLSVRSLSDPQLEESVRTALVDSGLPPDLLHLEVLESRALLDLPTVTQRLTALRYLGVRISLDDFGTGFSTLSWLLQLPVDQIKIDRTFVVACSQTDDPRQQVTAQALLRGFVAVGAELDVQVLAEGVETQSQLEAVRALGCTLVQGYLLGRPGPPAGLLPLIGVEPPGR